MRVKTLTTLLLAATAVAAHAKPRHAAGHAAAEKTHSTRAHTVAVKAERGHVSHRHAEGTRVSEARHGAPRAARAEKPVKLHGRAARLEAARLAREEKAEKHGRGRRRAELREVAAQPARGSRARAVAEPEPEPMAEAPAAAAAPEVHVTHNRKNHLKATPQDFMSVAPGQTVPTAAVAPAQPIVNKVVVRAGPPTAHAEAIEPVVLPVLYRLGRLVMPPAMKGSHEILVHQNVMATADGLERVQDDNDLLRMRQAKLLVPFPQVQGLQADERLPENRRFTRPWTAQFLANMARAHYAQFHTPLQVNSAVRTVEFQQRLMRTNGNAAPFEGETASPHLTGQAVDLAKKGLSLTEIAWMRGYLMPLVQQGKIDVEEEFQQACFHVSVYRKYMLQAAPPREIATRPGVGVSLAAAAMR